MTAFILTSEARHAAQGSYRNNKITTTSIIGNNEHYQKEHYHQFHRLCEFHSYFFFPDRNSSALEQSHFLLPCVPLSTENMPVLDFQFTISKINKRK